MTRVYILLGGLWGFDGPVTSRGMYGLAGQLGKLINTAVSTYTWTNWPTARDDIAKVWGAKVVVIGYSGGGSRATYLANQLAKPAIDLMVLYDPSPRWQMQPIGNNVKHAMCYYNLSPMMPSPFGMLGGGKLIGQTNIETFPIAEQHLTVQYDQTLHARTVAAVKALHG